MKGWQIFIHSVRLVLNNLGAAFRVSFVLYLLSSIYQVLSVGAAVPDGEGGVTMAPEAALSLFPFMILSLVASLWIAVAWHRYVLAEELPAGWLPRFHGPEILRYLGQSLMIGILIAGVILATLAVLVMIPPLQALVMPGMVLAGSYFFFRLGVMLPAGTIDRKMTIKESWQATSDSDGAIVILSVLMMLGSFVLMVPSMVSGDPTSIISLIYNIVTGWFATMIGVSILTTLYGHYVEGRPID